jgi:hypothetical protein
VKPLAPGLVPGWGASHWFADRGLDVAAMTPSARLQALLDYY